MTLPPREAGAPRARYALLVAVLLTAAVYSGNLIFYTAFGEWFGTALKACVNAGADLPPLERAAGFQRCGAPYEQARTAFAFLFALLAAALGWVVLRRLPARLHRRAGITRAAGARWQEEAAEAVRSLGGRVVPVVEFGSTCREAFTVRAGGRVRIVLPYGVLALPRPEASALLRHECAHVAAGDVDRVWLTRAVWWATPVVLALPLPWLRTETSFALDYAVRAALLLALVWVVSRSVLRSREHAADLLSTRDSTTGLDALLRRAVDQPRPWFRSLAALHPSTRHRLEVLARGEVERHVRAAEGFAFGALAGLVQPLLSHFVQSALLPSAGLRVTTLALALVPGVLLGCAWGPTVWRSRTTADVRPVRDRLTSALGLPLGVVVGMALSLIGTGTPLIEPATAWTWGFTVVTLIGATALCEGAAALWHRRRPGGSPRWAGALAALLFTGVLEAVFSFRPMIELGGLVGVWLSLTYTPFLALLAGNLVVAALAWRVAAGSRVRVLLLAVAVTVLAAGPRLALAGEATEENALDHLLLNAVLATAAGLVVFAARVVAAGRAGIAEGVAGAWVTTPLTALALTLEFGQPQHVVWLALKQATAHLALLLLLTAAVAAALTAARDRTPVAREPVVEPSRT
ncbi:M48 family metalloprotease [Actinosynnema pretiosum subsp. pretiosum]|uniref:M48 family metalloprotease n=1 Tax=Actinosynnema pretiosum subsp. pretiosum TaxID=103721 RepID=A0AA45L8T8_9PSEU|nr:M48 family metalloprotease [Actinosynnema pretiosum subsp. pretiosum]